MRRPRSGKRHLPHAPRGFDITAHVRRVCDDMTARLAELAHIDMRRVAVAFAQTRKRVRHGIQASLTPMRFEGGRRTECRGTRSYSVQPLFDEHGREVLYILTVYLPRFMDLDFREKLVTLVHELWHIGPRFDGDLRRHEGRCYVHSRSKRDYDTAMEQLAERWMASGPPEPVAGFLKLNFNELVQREGRVFGTRVAQPKLIPAASAQAESPGFPVRP